MLPGDSCEVKEKRISYVKEDGKVGVKSGLGRVPPELRVKLGGVRVREV